MKALKLRTKEGLQYNQRKHNKIIRKRDRISKQLPKKNRDQSMRKETKTKQKIHRTTLEVSNSKI